MNKNEMTKKIKRRDLTVYLTIRLLVIIVMILEILQGEWENVFLCAFTLVLLLIPIVINRRLIIKLPNVFENIILIFIFAAEILGEVANFYTHFPHWDTILHTLNGFLCAALGFSLVDLLNRSDKFSKRLTPIFVAIVAFSVSMTIGVLWEFFEFSADKLVLTDMQKDTNLQIVSSVSLNPEKKNKAIIIDDIEKTVIYGKDKDGNNIEYVVENGYLDIGLNDTMEDLAVNFIGATVFSILGYLYIKHRDGKYKFVESFILTLKNEEELAKVKKEIEEYETQLKLKKEKQNKKKSNINKSINKNTQKSNKIEDNKNENK